MQVLIGNFSFYAYTVHIYAYTVALRSVELLITASFSAYSNGRKQIAMSIH